MSETKYCISHTEGTDNWVLKEWVPSSLDCCRSIWPWKWGRVSRWSTFGAYPTEALAKAAMKRRATAITHTTFYDTHGGEESGF